MFHNHSLYQVASTITHHPLNGGPLPTLPPTDERDPFNRPFEEQNHPLQRSGVYTSYTAERYLPWAAEVVATPKAQSI